MRKILRYFTSLLAFALILASCSGIIETAPTDETISLNFRAADILSNVVGGGGARQQ